MKHLDKIFSKLTKLHINLALIKSYISFLNIKLLEQQINNLDMSTSKAKLETLSNLKFLQILQQLESYLELVK